MNKPIVVIVGLLVAVMLVLFSTTYTVKFNEVAIKQTFGQADESSIVSDPGLHYRVPVFNKVTKLDTRLQLVESPLEEIATKDDLQIVVRAFLFWRVDTESAGPLVFFRGYGSIGDANGALQGQFRTALGALSGYRFDELVGEGSRLVEAEESIKTVLARDLESRGIEAVTVGIKKIVLPPKTSTAVLSRMQATRVLIAEGERSAGTSEALAIVGRANTQTDTIMAVVEQISGEVRAEAEAEAAGYIEQQAEAEDLAIFLAWIDTLKRSLSRRTSLILPMSMEPFHLMGTEPTFQGAIPIPADRDDAFAAPPTDEMFGSGAPRAAATGEDEASRDDTEASE